MSDYEHLLRATGVLCDFVSVAADCVVTLPVRCAVTAEIGRDPLAECAPLDGAPYAVPHRCRCAEAVQEKDGHRSLIAK